MISARQLTRQFGDHLAVNSLNLEIQTGEICALIGPNGAGKSTTVKMLTGLLAPTSGQAIVCGIDVAKDPLSVKRISGVLPENLGLFDALTVEEHLDLTGAVCGIPHNQTKERTNQLLRILDLEHGRHTYAGACSHGMRKKTSLAMALLPAPKALFLDEPFEAIDPVTSRTIRDLLTSLAAKGITVFLTSHILPLVEKIATRIVLIRQGQIVWNSTPAELPQSLEDHYFELIQAPVKEELDWL
jgi:ABC-2 type transport system ATP-binding protein